MKRLYDWRTWNISRNGILEDTFSVQLQKLCGDFLWRMLDVRDGSRNCLAMAKIDAFAKSFLTTWAVLLCVVALAVLCFVVEIYAGEARERIANMGSYSPIASACP
jgi:hypothetical protein